MNNFNLTEWALGHRAVVLFLIIVVSIAGVFSFSKLGQLEDPKFSVPSMTATVFSPSPLAIISPGTTIMPAISTGKKRVMKINIFFRTAARYSRLKTASIFLMARAYQNISGQEGGCSALPDTTL